MAEDKKFIGKTNIVKTKYGEIVKIAFGPRDFEQFEQLKNEGGWLNLELKTRRDGGKFLEVQGEYKKNVQPQNATEDFPF